MTALETFIKDQINQNTAMRFDDFMGLCLGHPEYGYYMKQDPFGIKGDFITAPEISQLFGETLAIWLIQSMTEPQDSPLHFIEFGAGRGTLMADMLRTCSKIVPSMLNNVKISLIETSPVLKDRQREALASFNLDITWHESFESAQDEKYITRIIGNEFFDALPIRQFKKDNDDTWSELFVTCDSDSLIKSWQKTDFQIPYDYQNNDIYEYNEIAEDIVKTITAKPNTKSCFIDYGYGDKTGLKDTLQTVKKQKMTSLFDAVGDQDITAHVNFGRLINVIESNDHKASLIPQAEFLTRNGFMIRANQLLKQHPAQKDAIEKAVHRLTHREEMGTLFKVLEF